MSRGRLSYTTSWDTIAEAGSVREFDRPLRPYDAESGPENEARRRGQYTLAEIASMISGAYDLPDLRDATADGGEIYDKIRSPDGLS
jgi:hypothetical protein